jgi:hypothetical protein
MWAGAWIAILRMAEIWTNTEPWVRIAVADQVNVF